MNTFGRFLLFAVAINAVVIVLSEVSGSGVSQCISAAGFLICGALFVVFGGSK